MSSMFQKSAIRENIFVSPEVLIDITESEQHPYPKTLLPLVDPMWQIFGREGTPFKMPDGWYPFGNFQCFELELGESGPKGLL